MFIFMKKIDILEKVARTKQITHFCYYKDVFLEVEYCTYTTVYLLYFTCLSIIFHMKNICSQIGDETEIIEGLLDTFAIFILFARDIRNVQFSVNAPNYVHTRVPM